MAHKLLLADDSVTIQRVIELTFADEDIQVIAVGDGREAIARVGSERPDIVLADVGMPEKDGYEVAAFIKGRADLAHIPVLLLTGAFEPIDDARARAVGCDGVLVKPFEPQMVIGRVRDLLAGKREGAAGPGTLPGALPMTAPASAPLAAAGASLEDYFDRLDAALAQKAHAGSGDRPDPRSAPAAGAAHARSGAPPTSGPDLPERDHEPTSAAGSMPTEESLQLLFAGLLAAEQAAAPAISLDTLPPSVVDQVARRAVALMGDDTMKALVLDTAERLVREEIARIKSRA